MRILKDVTLDNYEEIRQKKIEMPYRFLKAYYDRQRPLCQQIKQVYNYDNNTLQDVGCGHWTCKVCRPHKKYALYIEILKNVYMFDLNKHFIITSEGKQFRSEYTFQESYRFFSQQWNKFKQLMEYHFQPINYIVLPRSQKDGYCHYHIIMDSWISWKWLNEKRKKYNLGFMSIKKNKSVAEYLANDYFKDREFVIPDNFKHYRSSRSIILNNYRPDLKNLIFFDKAKNCLEISNKIYEKFRLKFDWDQHCIDKIEKNIKNMSKYAIVYEREN